MRNEPVNGERDERAAAALAEYLSPKQAEEWATMRNHPAGGETYGYTELTVQGSEGGSFRIRKWYRPALLRPGTPFRVVLFVEDRAACFGADISFPLDDQVLAMKLMIELNERWVRGETGW